MISVTPMKKVKRKPTPKDEKVLQLKITLAGSKPPIWRRVKVRESMNLGELHRVVQIVMGWEDCHLHLFQVGADGRRGCCQSHGLYLSF